MALDYKISTYKLDRPKTRTITSYGSMSNWMQRRRQNLPLSVYDVSSSYSSRRPILAPSPLGMPSMHDTYLNKPAFINFSRSYSDISQVKHLQPSNLRPERQGSNWKHLKEIVPVGVKRLVIIDSQVASKDAILRQLKDKNQRDGDISQTHRAMSIHTTPMLRVNFSRYHMTDIRQGLEKHNWNIVR